MLMKLQTRVNFEKYLITTMKDLARNNILTIYLHERKLMNLIQSDRILPNVFLQNYLRVVQDTAIRSLYYKNVSL